MRNIFLEKSCAKCGDETSPKPSFKKSKYISGPAVRSFMQFVFIVYPRPGLQNYIESKFLITCFYFI